MKKTLVIARAGFNHMGDIDCAKKLTMIAKNSGCDAINFDMLAKKDVSGCDMRGLHLVDKSMYVDLKAYADSIKMGFMPTVFDEDSASVALERLGLRAIRVSSAVNQALLNAINQYAYSIPALNVFFSISGLTWKNIEAIIAHTPNVKHSAFMYSEVSNPIADDKVNLGAIKTLKSLFPSRSIGYSDHTADIIAPVLSVAAGAEVVEKHLCLPESNYLETSANPEDMKQMVSVIRMHDAMMGDGSLSSGPFDNLSFIDRVIL